MGLGFGEGRDNPAPGTLQDSPGRSGPLGSPRPGPRKEALLLLGPGRCPWAAWGRDGARSQMTGRPPRPGDVRGQSLPASDCVTWPHSHVGRPPGAGSARACSRESRAHVTAGAARSRDAPAAGSPWRRRRSARTRPAGRSVVVVARVCSSAPAAQPPPSACVRLLAPAPARPPRAMAVPGGVLRPLPLLLLLLGELRGPGRRRLHGRLGTAVLPFRAGSARVRAG